MIDDAILALTDADLRDLAGALRSGRLAGPFTTIALARYLAPGPSATVAKALERLGEEGFTAQHLALLFETLAADRAGRLPAQDTIDLVATGPEAPGVAFRDTSVVVRELFAHACDSVIVAGYAVYQGHHVFRALADRMVSYPTLQVRMFLDIHRAPGDISADSAIVTAFASRFALKEWPGSRLPEVYYDPRGVEADSGKRASLHAKCVVVDREVAFISSANFTEAAQARNIELGVLIRSAVVATKLVEHFSMLAATGFLRRVPGL